MVYKPTNITGGGPSCRNRFHEQPRIEVSEVPITIKLFMGGWSLLMIKQSQKEVVPAFHELRSAEKKMTC